MASDILSEILAAKAAEVSNAAADKPLTELRAAVADLPPPRGFIRAIETRIADGDAAVIAEIKKASPSKGLIRPDFAPADLARNLAEHRAACLSVLTDEKYFCGSADYLRAARDACALPVLRKDFIIDPYQVYESRELGADAVLLIVAALGDPLLRELAELAEALAMDVLVEVHNEDELARALTLPCRLIGINNRNLRTFQTDLTTTINLHAAIPADKNIITVTESGFHARDDIARMRQHGVHTFLIGEALMRADDPGVEMRGLFEL